MLEDYESVLMQAARLYDKHEVGRPKPFNIFPILRSESDEVNLHTPFLKALLDHENPGKGKDNLWDFLQQAGVEKYERNDVKIEKEKHNIDILVVNNASEAVIIENKIYAADQLRQLCRYYNLVKKRGYRKVHVLYLTLDGEEPSESSFCGSCCEARYHCRNISYKETILRWLECCQRRAYDHPELRETVAQYRQLIQKMTGMDFGERYMEELIKLCRADRNLILVKDLKEAFIKVQASLLGELLCEIKTKLDNEIDSLGHRNSTDISEDTIENYLINGKSAPNMRYPLYGSDEPALRVYFTGSKIKYGIRFTKSKDTGIYSQIMAALAKAPLGASESDDQWPWYRLTPRVGRNASCAGLALLVNEEDRQNSAREIAQVLIRISEKVRQCVLGGQHAG